MTLTGRGLKALLGVGAIAQLACFAPAALADAPLQVYGLTLDETRMGDGFCEVSGPADIMRQECAQSRQSLPKITSIEVETTPARYVMLTLVPTPDGKPRHVRIWYASREQGGQSYMITTEQPTENDLATARGEVLSVFGPPTVEFSHADMEARGIHVADLTVDTLIYVDRAMPAAQWNRMAYRLRSEFNPTGAELFSLTNTALRKLSRLLGTDFRGAIVQISESGWRHDSSVTTILLDLDRAKSIFQLGG